MCAKYNAKPNMTLGSFFTQIDPVTGKFNQGGVVEVHSERSHLAIGTKGVEYFTIVANEVNYMGPLVTVQMRGISRAPIVIDTIDKLLKARLINLFLNSL